MIILIVYFFIPSYHEILQLRDDIDLKKADLLDKTEYAQYLAQLADSTLNVEEDVINYALPSENDVITLLVTYEGLAKGDGVEVSPISLAPGVLEDKDNKKAAREEKTGGTQMVSFSMEVTADDDEAARSLIRAITSTRRIFDIQSLAWAEPTDQADSKLTLSLNLVTYYYLEGNTQSSRALVNQGQEQQSFISQLQNATVFEDLILEGVKLGKEDLFATESTRSASL